MMTFIPYNSFDSFGELWNTRIRI